MTLRRVTVVDDSPELVALFDEVFRDGGAEVTMLGSRVSIHQIERAQPELLVIDLHLGTDHLPGWELIRHIRAHPMLGEVPIIVCSGAIDQMRDHTGSGPGASRTFLLPKPFSIVDLEQVLAEAVGSPSAPAAPVSPGPSPLPDFAADPHRWFDHIGREVLHPRWLEVVASIEPSLWMRSNGHAWRVVRTVRGIEVRPELMSPFLRFGDQPMTTALSLGEEVEVELTTRTGRWVDRFPRDTFDVGALGRAMLDERKLPHDNLAALFPVRAAPPASLGVGDAPRAAFEVGPESVQTGHEA